jgi:tRNA A37 N6-isopentenylltransferase MiaA
MQTPWVNFLQDKKIIGYDDIISYILQNDASLQSKKKLFECIARKTRNYAKKQLIYWRRLSVKMQSALQKGNDTLSQVITSDLTLLDHDLYIKHLSDYISAQL